MKLIFATNNSHKVEEIKAFVGNKFEILSLKEADIDIEIPEPFDTLEENASVKSRTIYNLTGTSCFSEDTGLEVDALNGEPGVKSARYAGEGKSFQQNIEKLLQILKGKHQRKARFRAAISLIIEDKETLFEGICDGKIIEEPRGEQGFGYDPVFVPDGESRSFAEMSIEEKSKFNHRTKAAAKLVAFLQTLKTTPPN